VFALSLDMKLSTAFATAMVMFHASLIARNLTTNESVNWRKYPHMKRELGGGRARFFNAFDGGVCKNACWRLGIAHFDDKPLRMPPPPGPGGADDACCDHDHGHGGHSHQHNRYHDLEEAD
jgi:hypothetical protein